MIDVFILREQQWNAWWLQDFPSLRKELCGHMLILKIENKSWKMEVLIFFCVICTNEENK